MDQSLMWDTVFMSNEIDEHSILGRNDAVSIYHTLIHETWPLPKVAMQIDTQ